MWAIVIMPGGLGCSAKLERIPEIDLTPEQVKDRFERVFAAFIELLAASGSRPIENHPSVVVSEEFDILDNEASGTLRIAVKLLNSTAQQVLSIERWALDTGVGDSPLTHASYLARHALALLRAEML